MKCNSHPFRKGREDDAHCSKKDGNGTAVYETYFVSILVPYRDKRKVGGIYGPIGLEEKAWLLKYGRPIRFSTFNPVRYDSVRLSMVFSGF